MAFVSGVCAVCSQPLAAGRASRVCSPRCRTAQWHRDRAREHAATVAQLQIETATVAQLRTENAWLRQRVVELEHLVGQLKTRLWKGRGL